MRRPVEQRGKTIRYTIHIYSFKKYGFTKIADTLGEFAAHAIAGHRAYVITYSKKNREDRSEDYRKVASKLEFFQTHDQDSEELKADIKGTIEGQSKERLAEILEIARSHFKK